MKRHLHHIVFCYVLLQLSFSLGFGQTAVLAPPIAAAGQQLLNMTVTISSIKGTVDSITITSLHNLQTMVPTAIQFNQTSLPLLNLQSRPSNSSYVTWAYNTQNGNLSILRDKAVSVSTLQILFVQDMPQIAKIDTYFVGWGRQGSFTTDTLSITVGPGSESEISIQYSADKSGSSVDAATISADSTLQVFAVSRDLYGNFVTARSASWTVENEIGVVSPISKSASTVFTPTKTGVGRIWASVSGFPAAKTGPVTVVAGALDHLVIRSAPGGLGDTIKAMTLSANSSIKIFAAAYDKINNYLGDTACTWSSTGSLQPAAAGASPSFLFSPILAPASGTISCTFTGTLILAASTGLITVSPGTIASIGICSPAGDSVHSLHLTTDVDTVLTARGYDALGNVVGLVQAAWSDSNSIGTFSPSTGSTTTYAPNHTGTGIVRVEWNGLSTAVYLDVAGGQLKNLVIRSAPRGAGSSVDNLSLTTDTSLTLYAAGYDAKGNYLGDQLASWSISSGSLDSVSPVVDNGVIFAPRKAPTSGIITATVGIGPIISASTGTIVVNPGNSAAIAVTNRLGVKLSSITLTTDNDTVLFARIYDAHDNEIRTIPAGWSESGGTGNIIPDLTDSSATFSARVVGQGSLTTSWSGLSATIPVFVAGGQFHHLIIRSAPGGGGEAVGDWTLLTDSALTLYAAGYDRDSNYLHDISANWQASPGLGPLAQPQSPSLVFSSSNRRTVGYISADSASVIDSTGLITVAKPPALAYVSGSFSPTAIPVNDSTAFTLRLRNDGDVAVHLDTGSHLFFSDRTGDSIRAHLADTTSIAGGDSASILTVRVFIPSKVAGETYTPLITVHGVDGRNKQFEQAGIATDPNALTVAVIRITDISASKASISIGQSNLRVQMYVKNFSPDMVFSLDDATLMFGSHQAEYQQTLLAPPASIDPGATEILSFDVSVPPPGSPATDTIRGFIRGSMQGVAVQDSNPAVFAVWKVNSPPAIQIAQRSLAPWRVTQADSVLFFWTLTNTSETDLNLSDSATYLQFSDGTNTVVAHPISPITIHAGQSDILPFAKQLIPTAMTNTVFHPLLILVGTDNNGLPFSNTISNSPATVQVQAPAHLVVVDSSFTPRAVTQGQRTAFHLAVRNDGEAAVLLHFDTTRIHIGGFYAPLHRDSVVLGGSVTTIWFDSITVPESFSPGIYPPVLTYAGPDSNGAFCSGLDTAETVDFAVQTPPSVSFDSLIYPLRVTSGKVTSFIVDAHNTGQAGVLLGDSSSLVLQGTAGIVCKAHLETQQYLAGGVRHLSLHFKAIDMPNTPDTVVHASLELIGNDANGKTYVQNDVPAGDIHVDHPSLSCVAKQFLDTVSQGQTNDLSFGIRITNSSSLPVWVGDTSALMLYRGNDTLHLSYASPMPGSWVNTDSPWVHFSTSSIPASLAPGWYRILINFIGSDSNGNTFGQLLHLNDSVLVQQPPQFRWVNDSLFPARVTQGQNAVTFRLRIANRGQSDAKLDPEQSYLMLDTLFLGTQHRSLLSLLTLGVGKDTTLTFDTVTIPLRNGHFPLSVVLAGKDGNGRPFLDTVKTAGDSLIVDRGPVLSYRGASNSPDTITQGQTVSFSVKLDNRGDARVASLLGSKLEFDDGRNYVTAGVTNISAFDTITRVVRFSEVAIPTAMKPGSYTPSVLLNGTDENGCAFVVPLHLDSGEVVIQRPPNFKATQIVGQKTFTQGGDQAIQLSVIVHNEGEAPALCDSSSWACFPIRDSGWASRDSGRTGGRLTTHQWIAGDSSRELAFNVDTISSAVLPGKYVIRMLLHGRDANGFPFDTLIATQDSIEVQPPPVLSYSGGSNQPDTVTFRENVSFKIAVKNTGGVGVKIDSAEYSFDGGQFHASLGAQSIYVKADSIRTGISFLGAIIPKDSIPGRKTPQISLKGRDDNGSTYRRTILTDPNEVNIFSDEGLQVIQNIEPQKVTKGQDVNFRVNVLNTGKLSIAVDTIGTNVVFPESTVHLETKLEYPETVLAGSQATLVFRKMSISGLLSGGRHPIRLNLGGTFENGGAYQTSYHPSVDSNSVEIQNRAGLWAQLGGFTPRVITQGQDTFFFDTLVNNGEVAVILRPGAAKIIVQGGADTLSSLDSVVIPPLSGNVGLRFSHLTSAVNLPGNDSLRLVIDGVDSNGLRIDTILYLSDRLTVQKRPRFHGAGSVIEPARVTRGSQIAFVVTVQDSGEANAVLYPTSKLLFGNYIAALRDTTAISPKVPDTLKFELHSIADPSRYYAPTVVLFGRDANGFIFNDSVKLGQNILRVDDPPSISFSGTSLGNLDTVTIGDRNIDLKVRVRNTGGADCLLDSLSLAFFGDTIKSAYLYAWINHNGPVLIPGNDSVIIHLGINIGNAQSGVETPIFVRAFGSDQNLSGAFRTEMPLGLVEVHRWFVKPRPVFDIDSVKMTDTLIEDQTAPWTCTIHVTNHSLLPETLTSARLNVYSGEDTAAGFHFRPMPAAFDGGQGAVLDSGSSATLTFVIEKTGPYTGNAVLRLRAEIHGREKDTRITVHDDTTAAIRLLRKGRLELAAVRSNRSEVDLGGVDPSFTISCTLHNAGDTALDSLWMPADSTWFAGPDSIDRSYRCSFSSLPNRLPGDSSCTLTIFVDTIGRDLGHIGLHLVIRDTSAGVPGIVGIDTSLQNLFETEVAGEISLDSVEVLSPASQIVAMNESFLIRVYLRNKGDDRVRDVHVRFEPQPAVKITPDSAVIHVLDSAAAQALDFTVLVNPSAIDTFLIGTTISPGIADNTGTTARTGTSSNRLRFTVENHPPTIASVRFIDGGYNSIGDGELDKGDLIKIKFNERVIPYSRADGRDAADYFSIFPAMNTFGQPGSGRVKSADAVGYNGADKDSILFVELQDTTARFDAFRYSNSSGQFVRTPGQFTFEPTSIYINPGIDTGLIRGVRGSDAGFAIYRNDLHDQLRDTSSVESRPFIYGNYSLVAEDSIPPMMVNFYPRPSDRKPVSAHTPVKAFITGRNLIASENLKQYLAPVFPELLDTAYLDNPRKLASYLKARFDAGQREQVIQVRNLVNENYQIHPTSAASAFTINPFAQFYAPTLLDSFRYQRSTSRDHSSSPFSRPDSIYPDMEYGPMPSNPGFNIVILNNSSSQDTGNTNLWFMSKTADRADVFGDSVVLPIRPTEEGLSAQPGYALMAAPNPYIAGGSQSMVIEYDLPAEANIEVVIIDGAGRVVRSWPQSNETMGRHRLPERWDGRNAAGVTVSRGIYLAILKVDGNIRASWTIAVR